ncbi:MAG TPA: hypothetical protein VER03_12035, partial [Bryobacteraceae bacterium]|nr:hypothetical protein [Bryobacteraceae bacterium]
MRYASVLSCIAVSATFCVSSLAQDAAPKIAKPELPPVTSAPLNGGTDVPAVVQPIPITAPKPASAGGATTPVQAPPDPAAASAATPAPPAPKKVGLPVSEVPDELKSKASIAAQHARSNQTAEALALYTELLTAKADLFTIAVERGKLYQQAKDHAKAIADFGSAIKNSPG